jgi:hypothetical protein
MLAGCRKEVAGFAGNVWVGGIFACRVRQHTRNSFPFTPSGRRVVLFCRYTALICHRVDSHFKEELQKFNKFLYSGGVIRAGTHFQEFQPSALSIIRTLVRIVFSV